MNETWLVHVCEQCYRLTLYVTQFSRELFESVAVAVYIMPD